MQAGLRSMYRFFDRRRVWLSAGGGVILQGTSVRRPDRSLQPGEDARRVDRRFGAVVYAQLELRWFLLDRLSLDLFPRVSLPITHRDYRPGQKIPRLATTFELGAGVGVHF
jgi:hypothetical protein